MTPQKIIKKYETTPQLSNEQPDDQFPSEEKTDRFLPVKGLWKPTAAGRAECVYRDVTPTVTAEHRSFDCLPLNPAAFG